MPVTTTEPQREEWFAWRTLVHFENEPKPRLIVPWADPHKYEEPFDGLWDSAQHALDAFLEEQAEQDPDEAAEMDAWVLVKLRLDELPKCKHCGDYISRERFTMNPDNRLMGWCHVTGDSGRVYCDAGPTIAEPA